MLTNQIDVLLVSLPWAMLYSPSIQLGTLQSVVEKHGFSVSTRHYYLDAADYFSRIQTDNENAFVYDDYNVIAETYCDYGLGDWIFAVPPFKDENPEEDKIYRDYLKDKAADEKLIEKAFRLRAQVGKLLSKWLADILSVNPKVLGFSSVFSQNVPSLVLSKMVKTARPEIQIVFGGANCDGPMGQALIENFPWIDAVFRGEAEKSFPKYLEKVVGGDDSISLESLNALCFRKESGIHIVPQMAPSIIMDEVPMPNYKDYFDQLRDNNLNRAIVPRLRIPFESSRGCWWGEKKHCTFCGLNGTAMSFRSKNSKRVYDELLKLSSIYQITRFCSVDNIISMDHVRDLLPELKKLRNDYYDYELFYETKVNLKKEQINLMRQAGVTRVQPGIESLSTPILKLMEKGTTALQNIRFLKWAEQYGIKPIWNIICGFPDEPVEEYEKMTRLVSSLTHLPPPFFSHLRIHRFSPYHNDPDKFGINVQGPVSYYKFIYQTDDSALQDIAYDFQFSYTDGRLLDYVRPLQEAIRRWKMFWKPKSERLIYERGLDFLKIYDNRPNLTGGYYTFKNLEAEIYLACDAGAKVEQIQSVLSKSHKLSITNEEIELFLEQLVKSKLMFKENKIYLSLAIPRNR